MLPDVTKLKKQMNCVPRENPGRSVCVHKHAYTQTQTHVTRDSRSLQMSPVLSPPETPLVHHMACDSTQPFTSLEQVHFLN